MKVKEISRFLEQFAPLGLQESYDNSGLLIGSPDTEVKKCLITLDITNEVMEEAISSDCQLIVAHHPLIFKGIKRLTGADETEKLVVKAIKYNIAVYAIHTNLDNVKEGVNGMLARKLGLVNCRILNGSKNRLLKLVTFCPVKHYQQVRSAMFDAGAGHIGNYDSCSYNLEGNGTFRALEGADPFVGEPGKLHVEKEVRIEVVLPEYIRKQVVRALLGSHPYQEVAYDIYRLENQMSGTGAGMVGELPEETDPLEFLNQIKETLNCKAIKYNELPEGKVKKIAFCGGSGSFLIDEAFRSGADIFITGDIKYHDFFRHLGEMMIVDAGHYETEQFTKQLLYTLLKENFPNFALLISNVVTNPVNIL